MVQTTNRQTSSPRRQRLRGLNRLEPAFDRRQKPGGQAGQAWPSGQTGQTSQLAAATLAPASARQLLHDNHHGGASGRRSSRDGAGAGDDGTGRLRESRYGAASNGDDATARRGLPRTAALATAVRRLRIVAAQPNSPGDRNDSADGDGGATGYKPDAGLTVEQSATAGELQAASAWPEGAGGPALPGTDRSGCLPRNSPDRDNADRDNAGHNSPDGNRAGSLGREAENDSANDEAVIAATQKLIDNLRLMKRTRFNAQARFDAKHAASVSAFTLATIIEISLSLAGTNFSSSLSADVANFINYASQVTAVFILGFGLVVALADYQSKALYMQRCAMDWGNLSREMQIARPFPRQALQDYRRRYHEIEAHCQPNHADVDYEKARLDDSDLQAVRANRIDFFIDVYLVYVCSGIVYLAFWMALWQLMTA